MTDNKLRNFDNHLAMMDLSTLIPLSLVEQVN